MKTRLAAVMFTLLASAAVAAPVSAQSLTGKRVGIQYIFPDQGTVYQDLGANTVGTDGPTAFPGYFEFSFTDSSVTTSNFQFSSSWTSTSFNGFRLYDIDGTIDDFNVTLGASNMFGLDASRISGDANNVYVNWQGLAFDPSTSVTLNFASNVPEPATWALMILGLGAVGGAMRRRQSVAAKVRFA